VRHRGLGPRLGRAQRPALYVLPALVLEFKPHKDLVPAVRDLVDARHLHDHAHLARHAVQARVERRDDVHRGQGGAPRPTRHRERGHR
jgi:hypothetical protein